MIKSSGSKNNMRRVLCKNGEEYWGNSVKSPTEHYRCVKCGDVHPGITKK